MTNEPARERAAASHPKPDSDVPLEGLIGICRDAYERGFKDGFVDATITEDGFPDEATILKRVQGVNLAEGWECHEDAVLAALRARETSHD